MIASNMNQIPIDQIDLRWIFDTDIRESPAFIQWLAKNSIISPACCDYSGEKPIALYDVETIKEQLDGLNRLHLLDGYRMVFANRYNHDSWFMPMFCS